MKSFSINSRLIFVTVSFLFLQINILFSSFYIAISFHCFLKLISTKSKNKKVVQLMETDQAASKHIAFSTRHFFFNPDSSSQLHIGGFFAKSEFSEFIQHYIESRKKDEKLGSDWRCLRLRFGRLDVRDKEAINRSIFIDSARVRLLRREIGRLRNVKSTGRSRPSRPGAWNRTER